ncbi:pimelyl-ACP methyl ester esterase BioV [Sulfurospirillum arcachonense]|uniref:pimelyl-ACP methyl ester esterase BioV n=1 Tax=Sulfurospirillum arcachonense TaxID=57666 RepID=UPI0004690EF2|nr:pimelyl-ACP methyl ester esterase BioV [Sulfurospirillum arcachonense]
MKYFSGFCFKNESELFDTFTCKSDFCVVGFSYGAQKAFEHTLTCKERIDKLQLISPAFFQDTNDKFKKLQMLSFRKNSELYSQEFLSNITQLDMKKYFQKGYLEELKELLHYEWKQEDLQKIVQKGIQIEVYLGQKDKIINALHVKDFFSEYATVYYIKNVGHILR